MKYDIVVIGSGPGGYVAAIRGAQLGKKVAIIEKESLGGICLNWGCIPTKSLLKSAAVVKEVEHSESFGVRTSGIEIDFPAIIARSRATSETMSKGVKFLLDKAGVEIINGRAEIVAKGVVAVEDRAIKCDNIVIATGARAREIGAAKIDEQSVISYRKALSMDHLPKSMVVMGSGAIGCEVAQLYHTLGCKVTIVEYMPNLMPNEDEEVSKYSERMMRKNRLAYMTATKVESVTKHESGCTVLVSNSKGEKEIECEVVLSAVGVVANIENLGLEKIGVEINKGRIIVDSSYRTNIEGIYAIGDVIPGYQLAHVASAEAICAIESICNMNPKPVNYNVIPRCVYITPEVASVGITEREAKESGEQIRIGKFPFTASGKATLLGARDGFIKLIISEKDDKILGAHLVGEHVTEMISEIVVAMNLGAKAKDIIGSVHPHPSLSEAIMEAAAAAHNESVHI